MRSVAGRPEMKAGAALEIEAEAQQAVQGKQCFLPLGSPSLS